MGLGFALAVWGCGVAVAMAAPLDEAFFKIDLGDNFTRGRSLSSLTEKTLPSVVSIMITHHQRKPKNDGESGPADDPLTPPQKWSLKAQGSGFLIDKSGLIVTNHHVIDQADMIEVMLTNGQKYRAKLIGSDALADLALLKIENKTPLPFLSFGNSDAVKVGDWVMAVGNPFGLEGTVTAGILSARRGYAESGSETDLLQTDAPINRGNSGGPMLNMAGEVVGINSSIFANAMGESVRIGFAIPSNDAVPILTNLRRYGKVKRGNLGLSLQRAEPEILVSLLPSNGSAPAGGVMVALVDKQGPAAKAGVQSGDIITSFGGRNYHDADELARAIRHATVGQTAVLEIWHQKQRLTVKLVVSELPGSQALPPDQISPFGDDEGEGYDNEPDPPPDLPSDPAINIIALPY